MFWVETLTLGENLEIVSAKSDREGESKHYVKHDPFKSLLSKQGFDRSVGFIILRSTSQEQLARDFLICVERPSRKCWFFCSRVIETEPRFTPGA